MYLRGNLIGTDDGQRRRQQRQRTTDDGRRTMDDGRRTTDVGRHTLNLYYYVIFYLIKSAREGEEATYHAPHPNILTMAPSPLVRNHVKTWQGHGIHRQKQYQRTAGVSARWFDATNDKKHRYSLKKNTFCQHALWSAARGTISYKIKKELFSH